MLGTISAFAYRQRETKKNLWRGGRSQDLPDSDIIIIIIIIIIMINCNWVVTRWQWLFYMYTKHEIGY